MQDLTIFEFPFKENIFDPYNFLEKYIFGKKHFFVSGGTKIK